ncbi:ABC transporter ATP-binding protein [Agaribacterium haliotis]|uniref:ABC transporter ATP-binding protein n=1 Tax=Agaribacterium haliotis TaxID=2013869 RepID=UPI000BB578E4|nr:ABC transporter ATP-binding protein [Agaribacterium haliotis]
MYAFFERLLAPFPKQQQGEPPKSLLGFCLHYATGAKRYLFYMGFFTALIAALEVSLYGFVGHIVDWLNSQPHRDVFSSDNTTLWLAALVLLLLPFGIFMQNMLLHQTLLGNFPMRIRWLAHRHLLGHSMAYYQDEFAGRLATKVMQTALAVRETIMKFVDVLLYVVIYFISGLILVASLDWRLALPFLLWLACYITLLKIFLPKLGKISEKQADARSVMTGRIVDTYTNIATVKLFSHSGRELGYARDAMQGFLDTVYPQMRLATSLTSLVWAASALLIGSVGAISLWLWSIDAISTGAIAAACALVLRLNGMSHWIMWEVSALFENMGTVRDGINTLTAKRHVQDKADARAFEFKQGHIHFKQLDFSYGKDKNVIEQFELDIQPGEKVGLVGRSGAGKSTLVNLLLRFYDIDAGSINIDGQNIADLTQESLRQHIGMVTQDTSLLHRSVRDNLCYGRPDASEEQIIQACKQASALEFIQELEDAKGRKGLEAHVGERGVKLSGGQRQRIAIARALLKNAPILILDEATSALDSEVENAIQQNLHKLMKDKTVIAIAHRLSTIAELDRLIVMDEGKIVEQGSHAQLLKQGGIYARLWQHQSGGFLGEDG